MPRAKRLAEKSRFVDELQPNRDQSRSDRTPGNLRIAFLDFDRNTLVVLRISSCLRGDVKKEKEGRVCVYKKYDRKSTKLLLFLRKLWTIVHYEISPLSWMWLRQAASYFVEPREWRFTASWIHFDEAVTSTTGTFFSSLKFVRLSQNSFMLWNTGKRDFYGCDVENV